MDKVWCDVIQAEHRYNSHTSINAQLLLSSKGDRVAMFLSCTSKCYALFLTFCRYGLRCAIMLSTDTTKLLTRVMSRRVTAAALGRGCLVLSLCALQLMCTWLTLSQTSTATDLLWCQSFFCTFGAIKTCKSTPS